MSEAIAIRLTAYLFLVIMAGLLLMLLWNLALVPAIPVLKGIGWLQGIGIFVLSNILFKNVTTTTTINN